MRLSVVLRLAFLVLVATSCVALTACQRSRRHRPNVPTAGAAGSDVHPQFHEHEVVEIAVKMPHGNARPAFLKGLRAGLYEEAIERAYSPLNPEYVDRMETDLRSLSGPSHLTSAITAMRRESDGWLVSGWAALKAPTPAGGEVIYTMELTDYYVETEPDLRDRFLAGDAIAQRRAELAAGRRFGRALLTQFPRR